MGFFDTCYTNGYAGWLGFDNHFWEIENIIAWKLIVFSLLLWVIKIWLKCQI